MYFSAFPKIILIIQNFKKRKNTKQSVTDYYFVDISNLYAFHFNPLSGTFYFHVSGSTVPHMEFRTFGDVP